MKILYILLSGLLLMASCVKMEEVHQDYIPDGEIIYRAKATEVTGYSGINRAKLSWKLICPTFVTRCEIRQNDSVLAAVPVEYKDTVYLEHILTGLDEKTHTFSVYSLDADGNSSIKSDVIVEVFGEKYNNTLRTNTSLKSVWRRVDDKQKVLVHISERGSSKIAGTNIFYLDGTGKEASIRVEPETSTIEIANVANNSYFKLQDLYQPVINCIDLFPAPTEEYSASELPIEGSRTFSTTYKIADHTVYGTLTSSVEGTLRTIIKYGNNEIVVEPGVNNVTMEGVMPDDEISLETILQDADNSFEYSAPIQSYKVSNLLSKINMQNWEVIAFSSQQVGDGEAACAIDDQLSTFWHTQYSPEQPDYPHFIIVDMKENVLIKAIAIARREGNNNIASRFSLEVSGDNVNWELAEEFSVDNSIDGLQIVPLEKSLSGRYFRLTGKTSSTSNTYMCIGEINIFK